MDSILQNILIVTTTAEFWGVLTSVGFISWFIWKFVVKKYNIPVQVDEIVEDRIEEFTEYAKAKHDEIKAKKELSEKEKLHLMQKKLPSDQQASENTTNEIEKKEDNQNNEDNEDEKI